MISMEKTYEEKSRERNEASKYLSSVIGNNLSFWLCCAIPFLTILFVWVDTSLPKLGWALLGEGLPVVLLMVIGERLMVGIGAKSGKTDEAFLNTCLLYRTNKKKTLQSCGRMRAYDFCEWYTEKEYQETFRKNCRKMRISPEDYKERICKMKPGQLIMKYGLGPRLFGILNLARLDYIYLTPDMIFDEETDGKQRGIGESGEERVYKKTWGVKGIFMAAVTAACSVSIAMTLVKDPSWHRVLYTVIKVVVILYRMARGFNDGAMAFNKVEVARKNQQIKFLGLYFEYCEEKGGVRINEVSPELDAPDHLGSEASERDGELHADAG